MEKPLSSNVRRDNNCSLEHVTSEAGTKVPSPCSRGGWQRGLEPSLRVAPVNPSWLLAEWDWVQIFLENKYGGECRHGRTMRTMSFCSVLSFPTSKHHEQVSMNFLCGPLDIRGRDVWTVHGWLHLSWFRISASSDIFKLREFSSD